jgi:hypothetical protein
LPQVLVSVFHQVGRQHFAKIMELADAGKEIEIRIFLRPPHDRG